MDLSQSVLSQASSLFMSALGPEDQDIEISDNRSSSLLVGNSNNLASSTIITNNNHHDDPLQKQGVQYESEIQEQFNSLQNYQVNNDRTSLDGYQRLLQKLRQNIQLYELSSSSTSQTQQYKQQLKYYQNRYNVMERQFLLNQHVISSNNEPISNQTFSDDEDDDLEYGSSKNSALFETERLLRSSDQSLSRSMQLMHEIESSGTDSLGMLKSQREQMETTKHKLRGVQGDLVISDRLLNNMSRRKYYLIGGIALMILIIIVLFALITYGWVNRITS